MVTLMVAAIIVFDRSISSSTSEAEIILTPDVTNTNVPIEEDVFRKSDMALRLKEMASIASTTELKDYHENRAFDGAPPIIPHAVLTETGIGGNSCLQCHENGGYVAQFNAFAPITPHPEYLNCRQCHVPAKTNKLFSGSTFTRSGPKEVGNSALLGSPPVIPHTLQLRGNCLACHGGPSAPKEIRVSHPERINCRQCHAVSVTRELWTRKSIDLQEVSENNE